jgi:prepilin-type N-terminal cleavage/methylation domain-containing protein
VKVLSGTERVDQGFTLIEVMIAAMILATALLSLMRAQMSAVSTSEDTNEERIALMITKTIAEDIAATPFDTMAAEFPSGQALDEYTKPTPDDGNFRRLYLRDQRVVVVTVPPNPTAADDYLEATITISWTDSRGTPQTRSIDTARTR